MVGRMTFSLNVSANFRIGSTLPSMEDQLRDLWQLARTLDGFGLPLREWFPPADTEANSLLNRAFDAHGPTAAAVAMVEADKENQDDDVRMLGVWNGVEGPGGIAMTTTLSIGRIPSNLGLAAKGVAALTDSRHVVQIVQSVLTIWSPLLVQTGPAGYSRQRVFKDRTAVSWMLYLPHVIETRHAPEAASLIAIHDAEKRQKGTIVVSVAETFDVDNPEHVRRANALEVRLADQDLLPRLTDFARM